MGSLIKSLLPVAAVAAAPFTGGTSLLGSLGGIGSAIGTAGGVLSAVSAANSLLNGGQKQQKIVIENGQPVPEEQVQAAQEQAFSPVKPDEAQAPATLNELAAFSPEQKRSALATQGLNSGLGSDEESYYRNILQRSLIGDNNQVDANNSNFLMPIESQYFSKQGIDTSNIMNFLKAISGK